MHIASAALAERLFQAGTAGALPALETAFRTGSGVPYAAHGDDTRDAIAAVNVRCAGGTWRRGG